jgi:hypothetical protein
MSSPAPSPREPQNPQLAALQVQPGRENATGLGALGKSFPSGSRHLGDPPDKLDRASRRRLILQRLSAAGARRNGRAQSRRRLGLPPAPRPDPLLPVRPGPAPPRSLELPPVGSAHTCRTRCRASTKPSAFMPTGAFCPCTSSAITDPAAASDPRFGLPLRLGTRSRKGKVAPLPAEGRPGCCL